MNTEEYADIRGEYWIRDGHVDFADGNVGDRNHEGIAIDHVFSQYGDDIVKLADELEIPHEDHYDYDGVDSEGLSRLLSDIFDHLTEGNEENPNPSMNKQQAEAYLEESIGANREAMQILYGGGDGRLYVMKYEGWIAVRENNAELYGYDQNKQKSLAHGLYDILDQEGISEDIPPENVELSIYDHKTNKHWSVTLADLEAPPAALHSQTPATNAYKKSLYYGTNYKDSEENKYANSQKSKQNQWNLAAQKKGVIGPGQQLWRGTSESKYPSFLEWLSKNTIKCNKYNA